MAPPVMSPCIAGVLVMSRSFLEAAARAPCKSKMGAKAHQNVCTSCLERRISYVHHRHIALLIVIPGVISAGMDYGLKDLPTSGACAWIN